MKKLVIGAIVGGVLIFAWQFLSWGPLQLHAKANQYTDKQDAILQNLSEQLPGDGQYLLPTYKPGATSEEMQAMMNSSAGKPWAIVVYHKEMKLNMTANIIRGLLVNIVMVAFLCWIISKLQTTGLGNVLSVSFLVGLIVFLNEPYTLHIWYPSFDLTGHFIDALVSWGVCGFWLGWWYSRK